MAIEPREADLRGGGVLARALDAWIRFVVRARVAVVVAAAALTALSIVYAARELELETSRDEMIDAELAFRRDQERLEARFPSVLGELVVVVDAPTPEEARDVARELAARLAEREELFAGAFLPRANEFLERTALLHLDPDALGELARRLTAVQPFLGTLARDPSLPGLLGLLESALEAGRDGAPAPGPELELAPFLRELDAAARAALEGAEHVVSWESLLAPAAPEIDARRQIVLLEPRLEEGSLFPAGRALAAVRAAAAAAGAGATGDADEAAGAAAATRVRVTGGLALEHEELRTVRRGSAWIGAGSLAAVALLLVLGMRSKRLVLHSLATLVAGLAWTAGFATFAVGHLNLISITFAALYVGLAIDYAIHLCLRYRELSHSERRGIAALRAAAVDVGGALLLCCLTTAIGFLSFLPTDYEGVSELGLVSGAGMVVSLVASLTLLPALVALSPPPPERVALRRKPRESAIDFPVRHARAVRRSAAVLGIAALATLPFARFDLDPLNLRDPRSESVRTFRDLLATSRTSPWSLHATAPGEAAAKALAERLAAREEVGTVLTLASFVPARQEEKLAVLADLALVLGADLAPREPPPERPTAERIDALRRLVGALRRAPEVAGAEAAAASLGALLAAAESGGPASAEELLGRLERGLLATFPASLERLRRALDAEAVTLDDVPADWRPRWVAEDGTWRVEAFPARDLESPEAMRAFVEAVLAVAPRAAGGPRSIVGSGDVVVAAFRTALLTAVAATVALLLALLRSLEDVVLAVLPLALAGALLCAAMVLLGIPFNYANVIGLPLLLGVGVDSGIHMVHRARTTGAVGLLHTGTARAILLSAATTFASFFNLSFTPHPGTASLGRILALGIVLTLACTLLVLPAILAARAGARGPARGGRRKAERSSAGAGA